MSATGGQQRDVFRASSLPEEQLNLVVTGVHRVLAGAGDEFHGGPLAAEEAHRVIGERLEGIRDLPRVANARCTT
jgi:hypothetical protein